MALVFEDDFLLLDRGGDFMQRLQRVMEQMPEDWQVRRAGRSHRPSSVQSPDNCTPCVAVCNRLPLPSSPCSKCPGFCTAWPFQ